MIPTTVRICRKVATEHRKAFLTHIGIHFIAAMTVTSLFGLVWVMAH